MKVAVFHNFMDNIGGAEIVTLNLVRELNADLYTTNIDFDKISKMGFSDIIGRIFSIGKIPNEAPFRQQLAFWKFRKLNLSGQYDFFIISGDWAMSAAVNNHPNLWYAHSPLNELWAFKDFIRNDLLSSWKILPYDLWVSFNRRLTLKYAKSVDDWICNSNNTKKRIKKFYKQEAKIIYPPTATTDYTYRPAEDYWLSVNRLITHKRVDLQIKAFSKLPEEKLIIVGSYEVGVEQFESYKNYLENLTPKNVSIIHWVDNKKLKDLYAGCKGFITTAKDEDFGMTVVEAMASGKAVIAPNEGGYKETIINGKTGILIDDINEEKLAQAIKNLSDELVLNPEKFKADCLENVTRFDIEEFIKKIKAEIKNALEK
jgi:glycosyltransferase involved in cell wall biosynthesis